MFNNVYIFYFCLGQWIVWCIYVGHCWSCWTSLFCCFSQSTIFNWKFATIIIIIIWKIGSCGRWWINVGQRMWQNNSGTELLYLTCVWGLNCLLCVTGVCYFARLQFVGIGWSSTRVARRFVHCQTCRTHLNEKKTFNNSIVILCCFRWFQLESGYVVAGGGAVEAALSIYLEDFAKSLGSREQVTHLSIFEKKISTKIQFYIYAIGCNCRVCTRIVGHS